jgi:hypothetical protein
MPDALLKREEVELPYGWWHDQYFHGGVDKRVGWWTTFAPNLKMHSYVVLFKDGSRSPVMQGTNPIEEIE